MCLSNAEICPCGVEVSKPDGLYLVQLPIPSEDLLEHEFGLTIWINRIGGKVFSYWVCAGCAINGAGTRKNNFFTVSRKHGLEKIESANDIVFKVLARIGHGLTDVSISGEMNHSIDRVIFEYLIDISFIQ